MQLNKYLNETFDTISKYTGDVSMLRQAIIEELDAINVYNAMISKTLNADVKKVLEHIIEEEKHHIGELQALIEKLDPDYTKGLNYGKEEVVDELGIKL